MTTRRSFLTGLSSLIAAPAIVPFASLMPVKVMDWIPPEHIEMVERFFITELTSFMAYGAHADKQLKQWEQEYLRRAVGVFGFEPKIVERVTGFDHEHDKHWSRVKVLMPADYETFKSFAPYRTAS